MVAAARSIIAALLSALPRSFCRTTPRLLLLMTRTGTGRAQADSTRQRADAEHSQRGHERIASSLLAAALAFSQVRSFVFR